MRKIHILLILLLLPLAVAATGNDRTDTVGFVHMPLYIVDGKIGVQPSDVPESSEIASVTILNDEEAVNVIASMPKWIPGRSAGEIVRVKYTIPVTFKIAAQVPTNDSLVISTDTTIHAIVNQMPEFPGGQQVLFDYLSQNIRYPDKANGAQGRVIVTFVVEQDGSISNVEIAKSAGNKWLDQEGIRLVKSMPKWKPGRLKGKIVRVKYCVPITFSRE